MKLRASGEDYLETVLILGQRMERVRAIDVTQYLGFAKTIVSHGLLLLRQGGFLTRYFEDESYTIPITGLSLVSIAVSSSLALWAFCHRPPQLCCTIYPPWTSACGA